METKWKKAVSESTALVQQVTQLRSQLQQKDNDIAKAINDKKVWSGVTRKLKEEFEKYKAGASATTNKLQDNIAQLQHTINVYDKQGATTSNSNQLLAHIDKLQTQLLATQSKLQQITDNTEGVPSFSDCTEIQYSLLVLKLSYYKATVMEMSQTSPEMSTTRLNDGWFKSGPLY